MSQQRSRRTFIKETVMAGAGLWAAEASWPAEAPQRRKLSANDKLNIACIGAGGRAVDNIKGIEGENIVAFCDADRRQAAKTLQKYPDAKFYMDYRKMLDEMGKSIDAVVVSTPDHIHAPAAISAMKLGKHVYCEKPLAHSIWEAREMTKVARETGVATQMGIQGHSLPGHRRAVELLQAGALGPVREVHAWSDRPLKWWPQGVERPQGEEPVPEGLDWELWLGPAPKRPYHSAYLPFKWRGWIDFGTGAIGDMGIHNMDVAFWGLHLSYPVRIEAEQVGMTRESWPKEATIRYEFPARGNLPPVRLTWYDGGRKPARELWGDDLPDNGCLLIGSNGRKMLSPDWHANDFQLRPEAEFKDFKGPEPTIPRTGLEGDAGHYAEWIAACKGGPAALASFAYTGPMTEAVLAGNVALRAGKPLDWDGPNMKASNCPEADELIAPKIPKGWGI
jgi:predicted dehydrogenase